jgi:hypothetical protein
MIRIYTTLFVFLAAFSVSAQPVNRYQPFGDMGSGTASFVEKPFSVQKKAARPDLPGILSLDFGFNIPLNNTSAFDTRFFGSKVLNVQYKWEAEIVNKFSVRFGLGLGLEKYGFADSLTLVTNYNGATRGRSSFTNVNNLFSNIEETGKSQLAANYLDVPIEFFYKFKDTENSLRVGIGGRIGYLYSAHTKVDYIKDGASLQRKEKDLYGLNRWRYGATLRLGSGGFGGWVYYGLNTVFEDGRGPIGEDANQVQVGIYFNLF